MTETYFYRGIQFKLLFMDNLPFCKTCIDFFRSFVWKEVLKVTMKCK